MSYAHDAGPALRPGRAHMMSAALAVLARTRMMPGCHAHMMLGGAAGAHMAQMDKRRMQLPSIVCAVLIELS